MALSYAQLKGVWLDASQGTKYHTNGWASLMAAIAEAESGGNPTATNPTDNGGTQTSWGLWQISLGNHAAPAPNWADPAENAKLAIGKLNSQGLTAWGTYNSGAYRGFLSAKTSPDTAGLSAGPSAVDTAAATSSANAAADCAWGISFPIVGQACILSKSEVRGLVGVLVAVAGAVVMGGGLIILAATAGLKAAGPVAGMIPGAGKVAGAAVAAEPTYRTGKRAERKRSPEYESMTVPGGDYGTPADRRGTSPEFRSEFGLGA